MNKSTTTPKPGSEWSQTGKHSDPAFGLLLTNIMHTDEQRKTDDEQCKTDEIEKQ